MQLYIEIPDSTTLQASLPMLLNNDKTAISNSSGAAFPTANLQVGMLCVRTDLNQIFILTDKITPTWAFVADYSRTPLYSNDPVVTSGVFKIGTNAIFSQIGPGSIGLGAQVLGTNLALLTAKNGSYVGFNITNDGTNWNRIDTTKGASLLFVGDTAAPKFFSCSNGTNPIISWNIVNGATLYTTQNFNSADYVPIAGGTMTGQLTLPNMYVQQAGGQQGGNITFQKPAVSTLVTNAVMDVFGGKMRWWDSGSPNKGFYLDFSQGLNSAGSAIWHQGLMGPGTGMDADTVDGYQGSDLVKRAGDSMTGLLTLGGYPTDDFHAVPKAYVDGATAGSSGGRVWMTDGNSGAFSFVVPNGVTAIRVSLFAGGGGGAANFVDGAGNYHAGQNGFNGQRMFRRLITGLTPGAVIPVHIGQGGSCAYDDGYYGENSTFGTYLTASGGQGGPGQYGTTTPYAYAHGGQATYIGSDDPFFGCGLGGRGAGIVNNGIGPLNDNLPGGTGFCMVEW